MNRRYLLVAVALLMLASLGIAATRIWRLLEGSESPTSNRLAAVGLQRVDMAAFKSGIPSYRRFVLNADKPGAPIEIVIFTDAECPFCQSLLSKDLQESTRTIERPIEVYVRHLPLIRPPLSVVLAQLADCAGAIGGTSVFVSALTAVHQKDATGDKIIAMLVEKHNLNRDSLVSCLYDPRSLDSIRADMSLAQQRGFDRTPILIINGYIFDGHDSADGLNLRIRATISDEK